VGTYLGCKIYRYTPPDVAYEQHGSPCLTSNYVKLGAVKKHICTEQGGTWTWNDAKTNGTCSFEEPEPEPAKGIITSYAAPPSALLGDTVTVTATAKNTGETQGTFQLRLIDRDEGTELDSTEPFTLAAGASTTKTLSGAMPSRDLNLRLTLERQQ